MMIPRRSVFALVVGLMLATTASATEAKQITIAEAMSLLQAHNKLAGAGVEKPWEFGSGTLHYRIARNIIALAEVGKALEASRLGIVKEILKGMPADPDDKPPTEIKPGTPEFENFSKQIGDVLQQPASVTLGRIRLSELRLDKNDIPVNVLLALDPILDDDVTPK